MTVIDAPTKTVLDVLRDARSTLANGDTWCQNTYTAPPTGPADRPDKFCAIGAVMDAAGVTWELREDVWGTAFHAVHTDESDALAYDAEMELDWTIAEQYPEPEGVDSLYDKYPRGIIHFNDTFATNVGEVIEKFDATITRLEAQS